AEQIKDSVIVINHDKCEHQATPCDKSGTFHQEPSMVDVECQNVLCASHHEAPEKPPKIPMPALRNAWESWILSGEVVGQLCHTSSRASPAALDRCACLTLTPSGSKRVLWQCADP